MDRPIEIEAREFVRVSVRLPVLYRIQERNGEWGVVREGLTDNLSAGGLLLHARFPEENVLSRTLVGKTPIAVEISLQDGSAEPVRGICRGVWAEGVRGSAEAECRLGMRFTEMRAKDRDRIVGFVVRACL